MAIPEVCVSQYSLTVDASETVNALVQSADNPWGRRLHDALVQAVSGPGTTFVVQPYVNVRDADWDPAAVENAAPPEVGDRSADRVLKNLEAGGLVSTRTVLHESSSDTYLSEGRSITAVEVSPRVRARHGRLLLVSRVALPPWLEHDGLRGPLAGRRTLLRRSCGVVPGRRGGRTRLRPCWGSGRIRRLRRHGVLAVRARGLRSLPLPGGLRLMRCSLVGG